MLHEKQIKLIKFLNTLGLLLELYTQVYQILVCQKTAVNPFPRVLHTN